MKYIFYSHYLMACLFFQACNSFDQTIQSKKAIRIDSAAINDSIVINDQLAINNASPNVVVNNKDPFLQMHQDTVFFKDKKFSGTIFNLYANGDTLMKVNYFNGLEQGEFKKWYPNKKMAESRFFQAGKKWESILVFGKTASLNLNIILQRGNMMVSPMSGMPMAKPIKLFTILWAMKMEVKKFGGKTEL